MKVLVLCALGLSSLIGVAAHAECSIPSQSRELELYSQRMIQIANRSVAGSGSTTPSNSSCFQKLTCTDRTRLAQILSAWQSDPQYTRLTENEQRKLIYSSLLQVPGDSGVRLRANFWQGEMQRSSAISASSASSSSSGQPASTLWCTDPKLNAALPKGVETYKKRVEEYLTALEHFEDDSALFLGLEAIADRLTPEEESPSEFAVAGRNLAASSRVLDSILTSCIDTAAPNEASALRQLRVQLETQNQNLAAQTKLTRAEKISSINPIRSSTRLFGSLFLMGSGGSGSGSLATALSGAGWAGLMSQGSTWVNAGLSDASFWCELASQESENQSPIMGTLTDWSGGALASLGLTGVMGALGAGTSTRVTQAAVGAVATAGVATVVYSESQRLNSLAQIDAALETSRTPEVTQCLQTARAQALGGVAFDVGALLLGFTGVGSPKLNGTVASTGALSISPARARALTVAAEAATSGKLSRGSIQRFVLEATDLYHLDSPTGLSRLADIYDALRGLPKGHFVERLTPGSQPGRYAVIGRGHDGVLTVEASLKNRIPGADFQTFHPSESAMAEWTRSVEAARASRGTSAQLTREEVQATALYRENMQWIDRMKREGVTILDVGNSKLQSEAGFFYEAETLFLYGASGMRSR